MPNVANEKQQQQNCRLEPQKKKHKTAATKTVIVGVRQANEVGNRDCAQL